MSFGRAGPDCRRTTEKGNFADMAGADEVKEELEEIVRFLKNPKVPGVGAKYPRCSAFGAQVQARPCWPGQRPARLGTLFQYQRL